MYFDECNEMRMFIIQYANLQRHLISIIKLIIIYLRKQS